MNLPREIAPPAELRDAIAKKLQRNGLLRTRTPWLAIAASIAIIAIAGAFLWKSERTPPQANYILLLYESPQFSGGSRAEYAKWARDMRPLIVGGEELSKSAVLSIGTNPDELAGYFLINARDAEAAERVARACPHLKHGGAVILRRIM